MVKCGWTWDDNHRAWMESARHGTDDSRGWRTLCKRRKPWENHGKTIGQWWFNVTLLDFSSGKGANNFGKSPFYGWVNQLFLMAMFNGQLLVYQKVLVGGWKKVRQLRWLLLTKWKKIQMFQTTNQNLCYYLVVNYPRIINRFVHLRHFCG